MTFRKYDVILVDFGDSNIGSEQNGIRPAIIVQNDKGNIYSSTTVVAPLTSKPRSLFQPTHTLVRKTDENGLKVDSIFMAECLKQISEKRIIKYLGCISDEDQKNRINATLRAELDK